MISATEEITHPRLLDLLALTAGGLSVFSFAPFGYSALAPLSLFLLFGAWTTATPARAALRGFLFGLGQFGAGVSWVYISMHDYSGADVMEAAGLTGLLVAGFAVYPALAGWLALLAIGRERTAWGAPILFPVTWIGIEWLRGWFLTGFPWLQVGYSQIDTWIGQAMAPLGGVHAAGSVVALIAGLSLVMLGPGQARRQRVIAGLLAVGLVASCFPLSRIAWTRPEGRPVSVALLQGNVSQRVKWLPETKQATLTKYRDLTRQNWDARLIVWPETAVPAFLHQVKDGYLAELQAEATEHGTDVLIGIPVMNELTRRYTNSMLSLAPEGGFYHKRHMVPFGEYLPLRTWLGVILDILQIPLADFEPGEPRQPSLRAVGYPMAASICFEDVFGAEARSNLHEAAYLVNITNDAWFGDSIEPYQHHQMARMRALEAGRYMLRATNTGITSIIGPNGQVLTQLPLFYEGALRGQFQPMLGLTPYARFGDMPIVALLSLALLIFRAKSWNRFGLSRLKSEAGDS